APWCRAPDCGGTHRPARNAPPDKRRSSLFLSSIPQVFFRIGRSIDSSFSHLPCGNDCRYYTSSCPSIDGRSLRRRLRGGCKHPVRSGCAERRLLPPEVFIGGKAVQHFCPECNRNYDCQVELTKEYATLMPHGLRCGTPFEWRCPECARKDVLLHGKTTSNLTDFAYTTPAA